MEDKKNIIVMVGHKTVSKSELIELINKNFPDDEVGRAGNVAQITTVRMTDGTVTQSVLFGKVLNV